MKEIKLINRLTTSELDYVFAGCIYKKIVSNPLYSNLSQTFYDEYYERSYSHSLPAMESECEGW